MHRQLEPNLKHGGYEYVQVLRLLENLKLEELTQAIEDALERGTIDFDAVKCRVEQRPPRMDMRNYPHLPPTRVRTYLAADYMSLLAGLRAQERAHERDYGTCRDTETQKLLLDHHLKTVIVN